MTTVYRIEGRDEHGYWNWMHVASDLKAATCETREEAEDAVDNLVETTGNAPTSP